MYLHNTTQKPHKRPRMNSGSFERASSSCYNSGTRRMDINIRNLTFPEFVKEKGFQDTSLADP